MINEKVVAKEFNCLWEETLPLLTPSFVRLFNAANSEDLTELPKSKFQYIPIGPDIEKHDLVAELSFQIAKLATEKSTTVEKLEKHQKHLKEAYKRALKFLKKYEDADLKSNINQYEIAEAYALAKQYEHFYSYINAQEIEFSPRIAGSGFLGVCEADLAIDDTLYEVKTISRNFAGKDLKQLIIYLALQHSSGTRKWLYAGFFNPRKSLHYKFSIDHLIYRTSGGRSTSEVFKDIIDFLENRGIEIDAIF